MSAIIAFLIFVAASLVVWAVAETKYKNIHFTHSAEEAHEEQILEAERKAHGEGEMGIRDVVKNISAKGYKAV